MKSLTLRPYFMGKRVRFNNQEQYSVNPNCMFCLGQHRTSQCSQSVCQTCKRPSNRHSENCAKLQSFFNKMTNQVTDLEDKNLLTIDFNQIEGKAEQEREEVDKTSKVLRCYVCGKRGHINCFFKGKKIDCDVIFNNVFELGAKQI